MVEAFFSMCYGLRCVGGHLVKKMQKRRVTR